ncbi:hypothetical protein TNCV_3178471 [Trichonephila clavipes]|nr:hypothetical protein TNCV_3178471 [Trichonephila clavipes]
MLKVADGNFVRPIGKCVLRPYKQSRTAFEFIVLSHCSHDVILGWDFLEASRRYRLWTNNCSEDICRDSQRLTPGICMPSETIHLNRIL